MPNSQKIATRGLPQRFQNKAKLEANSSKLRHFHSVAAKPLARDRREARAMLDAARRSGALHGYAETEVFAPAVVQALSDGHDPGRSWSFPPKAGDERATLTHL